MKSILKIFVLGIALSLTGCSESDALINQVLDTVDTESGAILRTIGDLPDLVTVTNESNNFINFQIEVHQGDRKSTPSELQSHSDLVCRLLLEKKNKNNKQTKKKQQHQSI